MGSLGKNGENDKEVEQLIDEPTNGSGDPDLGLIFLPIWLTHSTQISSPESGWHNNYCCVTYLQNWVNSKYCNYFHSKRQLFRQINNSSDNSCRLVKFA